MSTDASVKIPLSKGETYQPRIRQSVGGPRNVSTKLVSIKLSKSA